MNKAEQWIDGKSRSLTKTDKKTLKLCIQDLYSVGTQLQL